MTPSTQAPGARLVPFELPAATGLLQPWADEDLDDLCDALQDRVIGAWNGSGSASQQTAAQFLRDRQDWGSGNTRHGPSQPHTRALIGSISLHRVDGEQSSAEIGYWTAPAARGHGAATHAVVAVCHWAFDALQLERIELRHAVENTGSARVAKKTGYTVEGHLRRSYRYPDGHLHDNLLWSRLRDDPAT